MSDDCNEAYTDRNLLAQVCARLAQECGWNVGLRDDPDEPDWPVLYIGVPSGDGYFYQQQWSWHLPKSEVIGDWPVFKRAWDGHTTEQKRAGMIEFLERYNHD